MLAIVEERSKLDQAAGRGEVVIRAISSSPNDFTSQIEELKSIAARNLALKHAAQCGITPPRINGNTSAPYAVNSKGIPLEEVQDSQKESLPLNHPEMQPAEYWITVPVCGAVG